MNLLNDYWCLSIHFSPSLIVLLSFLYDLIPMSFVTCFMKEVLRLPFPSWPYFFSSIVVVIQELFLIVCPIQIFFFNTFLNILLKYNNLYNKQIIINLNFPLCHCSQFRQIIFRHVCVSMNCDNFTDVDRRSQIFVSWFIVLNKTFKHK